MKLLLTSAGIKNASINDAMVARCGCDARTNVAVAETGFPAYFIRLDPETKISEVMILPRGDRGIVAASGVVRPGDDIEVEMPAGDLRPLVAV